MTASDLVFPSVPPTLNSPKDSAVKKKRVLLVDTCRVKRDIRAETMRRLGLEVDCAGDIGEARGWWKPDLYNLVLFHVEDEQVRRDKFCDDIRISAPQQQIAFFVGKPEYLASLPHTNGASASHTDDPVSRQPSATVIPPIPALGPQRWGILEACRRISAVRSVADARSRAMRDKPTPPRDLEAAALKRSQLFQDFGENVRKEMQ
jgi:CheY-like chemotaxis protein